MATVKVTIFVSNLANVMSLYDKIEVHRGEAESGPYVPITTNSEEPAAFLGTIPAPFSINGKTLSIKVDGGTEQTVTFASPNPVGIDATVEEINDQTTDLLASAVGSKLLLESDSLGTGALLEITDGTALTDLGLTASIDNGEDEKITLLAGVTEYEYDDKSGDADYYYITRYYNSISGAVSSFSDPQKGNVASILPTANMILAKIDLCGLDGSPLEDRKISIFNVFVQDNMQIDDVGVMGGTVELVTDQSGHAECYLIKGTVVDVTIVGTGITRRITIPSSGSDFNLLDEIAIADDVFQIRTPSIPAAVRRTL